MAHAPQFLKLVQDAKQRVKETNVPDVKRRIDAGEKLILVDVREDNEWTKGHLPGAVHMGKGVIERDIEQQVPDTGTKLVLYCGGGFRSALVADNLQKMGYTNVESMDGGWGGRIRTSTVLINSEVSYRLDHAPAADGVGSAAGEIDGEEFF
jgi:rhodanese-related sulfurtransferase